MSFLNNSSSKSSSDIFLENNPIHLFCNTRDEINQPNEYGWTPLYRALISNHIEAMKELLKEGADPNIANNMNETPLYQAIDNDNKEAMLLLLDNNANCNICKSDGNSPLHLAIKKLAVAYIEPLLNKGANPNLKNKLYQQTPLHLAIKSKLDISIIKLLFEHNADFKIKDKYDCVPMDYCDDSTYKNEIQNIIHINNSNSAISSKANITEIESNNNTPNNYIISQSNDNNSYNMKYSSKTETDTTKPNALIQNVNCTLSSEHKIRKNNTFNINNINNNNNNFLINKHSPSQFLKQQYTTSNFNLSTPSKTNRYNNLNQYESNSGIDKELTNEINPLDLINQVVTTTNNSNIFSELQNNTQDLPSAQKIDDDMKTNNQFDNTLQENDLTYSKSKSNIINELPLTSKKKHPYYNNANEQNNSEFLFEKDKELNITNNNKVNINYKAGIVHINQSNQKKNLFYQNKYIENKENDINVTNIPLNTNNYLYIEENNNNNVNINTKGLSVNKNEINTSYGGGDILYNSNFVSGCDISNSSNKDKDKEMQTFLSNRNTSNIYSNISTRPGTLHNSNYCKPSSNYNSTRSSNDNNKNIINVGNLNTYTLGVASTSSNVSPKVSAHFKCKKSSILSNYSYKGNCVPKLFYEDNSPSSNQNTIDINNTMTTNNNNSNNVKLNFSSYNAKRLHEWLLSCDLLRYYNILIEQGIYNIDKCINGIQTGDLHLTYKDIEDIGIKKPGHIYRFLIKLHCDAGIIDNRIVRYIFPMKTESNDIHIGASQNFCGCSMGNRKGIKEYDVESWLRSKGLGYLKDNFMHNGFDIFEFIIIQLFSSFMVDDNFLLERMHIYNGSDRYKLRKAFNYERKMICKKLGKKYVDIEQEEENRERIEQCEVCILF